MKFFTPELFVALNSQDESVVDEAMDQWDAATKNYEKHFAKLQKKLPKAIVDLVKYVERPAISEVLLTKAAI
jgi:hypothetical protein